MTNNSQALKNLVLSAKKKQEERELIEQEIEKQNLKKLRADLLKQFKKELTTIEASIQSQKKEEKEFKIIVIIGMAILAAMEAIPLVF